jgi:hypothetical protein
MEMTPYRLLDGRVNVAAHYSALARGLAPSLTP